MPTFGDFAAGPDKACFDRGKPPTRKAQSRVVAARLLPAFGPVPLDRIDRDQRDPLVRRVQPDRTWRGQQGVEPSLPNP